MRDQIQGQSKFVRQDNVLTSSYPRKQLTPEFTPVLLDLLFSM